MRFIAAVLLIALLAGCRENVDGPRIKAVRKEIPVCNLPAALRQKNWLGTEGTGSCTHAVIVTLLNWQNEPETAAWYRRTHGNGETAESLAAQLDAAGINYAYTVDASDTEFLELAIATARGCGVAVMGGQHFVTLVHLDERWAGLIDNNNPRRVLFVDRDSFLSEWEHSGSWATAILHTPAPPLPYGPRQPDYDRKEFRPAGRRNGLFPLARLPP